MTAHTYGAFRGPSFEDATHAQREAMRWWGTLEAALADCGQDGQVVVERGGAVLVVTEWDWAWTFAQVGLPPERWADHIFDALDGEGS